MSSSYKSQILINGINNSDESHSAQQDESNSVLITVIDKLKRELAVVKQSKNQLETLYKVNRSISESISDEQKSLKKRYSTMTS